MQPGCRAIFIDGKFSYVAFLSPYKFIDIPPDGNANNFFDIEGNPGLVRELIRSNSDIRYVFCWPGYTNVIDIVKNEFGGKLICEGIYGRGLMYELPVHYNGSVG